MSTYEQKQVVNEDTAFRQRVKDSVEQEVVLIGFQKELVAL